MLTNRSRIGVAAVDGLLYAFGGYDGTSRLQTVECFDPKVHVCIIMYSGDSKLCIITANVIPVPVSTLNFLVFKWQYVEFTSTLVCESACASFCYIKIL